MKTILTIDIGGTEIKSALHNEQGELLITFDNQKTRITKTDNSITEQVIDIIQQIQTTQLIDGVAIATAGVVNPHTGEIIFAGPTIPNYTGTNLKQAVEKSFNLPCSVENDVNAFALGEVWQGAAKDCQSALCLTIGTGLGGAVLINGKLWHGDNFSAGEVGYIPLPNGQRLEEVASASAMLKNYYHKTGDNINGKEFFERLKSGNTHADECLNLMIDTLAQGILPAIYLFAPTVIVIGGGITAQKTILEPRISKAITDKLPSPRFMPQIHCATLGNRANMLGALRHWLNCHNGLTD